MRRVQDSPVVGVVREVRMVGLAEMVRARVERRRRFVSCIFFLAVVVGGG